MNHPNEANILIVDDQPDNIDTIIGYLNESKIKYKFLQAINGELACKVAEKRIPDLIIMDWEMPVMNGYEALLCIKKNPLTADIPVVMATGRSSGSDLERALESGAADYIRKPIEKQELLARVKTCLSLSRMIKEIKTKNEALTSLNEEKDGILGIVAHDLRSPFNSIKGLTQLVELTGGLSEEQKKFCEKINYSIGRGHQLINDLLDIGNFQSENSAAKINVEKIKVEHLLNELREACQKNAVLKKQTLTINTDDSIELSTDKFLLWRVLENLTSNAIKYSPEGKPIHVTAMRMGEGIEFTIKDEGLGFSEEDKKKMFGKFQKLSARPTGGESSTGLGLSIVKMIVEKLSGSIKVESEQHVGSKFTVTLPNLIQ